MILEWLEIEAKTYPHMDKIFQTLINVDTINLETNEENHFHLQSADMSIEEAF